MKTYILSPEATEDLSDIKKYLLLEAGVVATRRVMSKINAQLKFLNRNPGIGHRRADLSPMSLRFYPVFSYLVIYIENRPIRIARVLHGSRDVASILNRE